MNAIKSDPDTMKRLSEENRRTLSDKLKDIEPRVSEKILTAYRYLAKASSDSVKIFDLGIPTVGEKPNLARRVKEYLEDQEILLTKIAPKIIIEKTFSKDEEQKKVSEVWEAFLKYPTLPILEDETVLKMAIVEGVQSKTFGLSIGDLVSYGDMISTKDIVDESVIVRKEVAEKLRGRETTPFEPAEAPTAPSAAPGPKPGTLTRLSILARVPWDKLSDLVRGALIPLNKKGGPDFLGS